MLVQGLGYPFGMWYRLRPTLEARYRVLWLDNRGVGRSVVPPVTVEAMAADALAVLDEAGADQAHVLRARCPTCTRSTRRARSSRRTSPCVVHARPRSRATAHRCRAH
ncbi:alpha/beta fold hydrolase [Blastococcus goldschmidtiae]|uniref:alpha/beta fold hydrolase n=1 Tax=Blastococcus goldschmidtiae TaxID=3075546 RepID=UPI0037BEA7DA